MDRYLSQKIAFFHFLGVIIILYLHVFLPNIEHSPFNAVQSFISKVVCRVFHPMYFSIAGFLFFYSIKDGRIKDFLVKMKKRVKGLLIPYLLCNILGAIFIIWMSRLGVPSGNLEDSVHYYETHNILLFLFYKPALGQLWFVRDLICIAVLSYPLYLAIKHGKIMFMTLFLLVIIGLQLNGLPLSIFTFAIGAYLAINRIDVTHIKHEWIVYLLGLIYLIAFGIVKEKASYCVVAISSWSLFLSLWCIYDRIRCLKIVNYGGGFFVYVFHDPLMSITKWSLHDYYQDSILMQSITYLSLPIIFYVMLSFIASKTKKCVPAVYRLLTGGR